MSETTFSHLNESELLQRFKAGDKVVFEEIYKRHWAILFRHARRMLKNDEEAKDVVQDVFTVFLTRAFELNIQTSLSSYLYSAVRYKIFDLIDRSKVHTNYLSSLEKFINDGTYITDDTIRERELSKAIEREISQLPEKMRKVFELSRKHNFSYKEISTQMKISENTVKKQISNALKILRVKLGTVISLFFLFF